MPSFWGKDIWVISLEEFHDKLKNIGQYFSCLVIQGEEAISETTVINGLCEDLAILTVINKIIQSLPTTCYEIRSWLVVVITKYKNGPSFTTMEWDKMVKLRNHLK